MRTLEQPVVGAADQVVRCAPRASRQRAMPFPVATQLLDQPVEALRALRSVYPGLKHPGKRLLIPVFTALACRQCSRYPIWLKDFTHTMLDNQLALYRQRDLSADGLPCLFDPQESLLPGAPYWDSMEKKSGHVVVQEPLFLALISWANESLLYLAQCTNLQGRELLEWQELTTYSMNEQLWDTEYGIYLPADLTTGDTVLSSSLAGVVPLVAAVADQNQAEAMRRILQANFLEDTHYFFPTSSIFNQSMAPNLIDAGAVDPFLNWLLFFGFLRYDFDDLAIHLRNNMLELLGEYGFYRYYESERNALGNRGIGEGNCPTTAALFAHLAQAPLQHPFYHKG